MCNLLKVLKFTHSGNTQLPVISFYYLITTLKTRVCHFLEKADHFFTELKSFAGAKPDQCKDIYRVGSTHDC